MQRLIFPAVRRLPLVDKTLELLSDWERFFRALTVRSETSYLWLTALTSYPVGLTITGVASTASITISAHTRIYPDVTRSLVTGSVLSLTYGTTYYLYYDDPKREGGTVTYATATTLTDAFATVTNANRHYVGKVTMPANAGASNTTGTPARPPGYT